MTLEGVTSYLVFFATMAGIYAGPTLGLNIQVGTRDFLTSASPVSLPSELIRRRS